MLTFNVLFICVVHQNFAVYEMCGSPTLINIYLNMCYVWSLLQSPTSIEVYNLYTAVSFTDQSMYLYFLSVRKETLIQFTILLSLEDFWSINVYKAMLCYIVSRTLQKIQCTVEDLWLTCELKRLKMCSNSFIKFEELNPLRTFSNTSFKHRSNHLWCLPQA